MKRGLSPLAALALVAGLVAGAACLCRPAGTEAPAPRPVSRPAQWAVPMQVAGCPNLHKVSDSLYRGAQPTAEGLKELEKLGIKTVVNLRSAHSDKELLKGLSLNYVEIEMTAWHAEGEDIVRFLKVMADGKNAPVFVHCQHGADRTGTTCAIYRIAVQGWTKEAALKEMTDGGYGFHELWQNLIRYIKKVDIEALKRRAGMAETGAGNHQ